MDPLSEILAADFVNPEKRESDIIEAIKTHINTMIYPGRPLGFNPLPEEDCGMRDTIYYKDLIKSPEKFSLSTLFNPFTKSFRKYCVEVLKDRQLFFRVLMIKINYFVLTLFLMINFIILFFYMRKRGEQKKAGLYNFIFLPITAILINIVFIHLFKILKKALVIGSSGYLYLTIINLAYYVFLFILFFILFRLLYFEEEEIKVEGKKKKKRPLGAAPAVSPPEVPPGAAPAGDPAGAGPRGAQTP